MRGKGTICPIQVSPSIPNHPVPPTPLVMPLLTIQATPLVLVHSLFQVVLITFDPCCSQWRCHGVPLIIGPLVELGWRGMVLMTHMMDGLEQNHNFKEYYWIWIEASRLSGTIYEGVIWLEQQIEFASEVLYNSNTL